MFIKLTLCSTPHISTARMGSLLLMNRFFCSLGLNAFFLGLRPTPPLPPRPGMMLLNSELPEQLSNLLVCVTIVVEVVHTKQLLE